MGSGLSARLAGYSFVVCYLDYCPVVWSSAASHDLVKLQLAQHRAARRALYCNQWADINTMHASLSWLRVESLLLFIWNIVLKIPTCLHRQLTHSSDTHTYPTRHATRGLFTGTKKAFGNIWSPYCMELRSISYKKKQIKQHLMAQRLSLIWPR